MNGRGMMLALSVLAAVAFTGAVVAFYDLRQQNLDHSYAVGWEWGRSVYDPACHRAVEARYPRRFVPETDMGAWLEGCLATAHDGPEPLTDWSTIGPPGPTGE